MDTLLKSENYILEINYLKKTSICIKSEFLE